VVEQASAELLVPHWILLRVLNASQKTNLVAKMATAVVCGARIVESATSLPFWVTKLPAAVKKVVNIPTLVCYCILQSNGKLW
jgi:hypothetical protein